MPCACWFIDGVTAPPPMTPGEAPFYATAKTDRGLVVMVPIDMRTMINPSMTVWKVLRLEDYFATKFQGDPQTRRRCHLQLLNLRLLGHLEERSTLKRPAVKVSAALGGG